MGFLRLSMILGVGSLSLLALGCNKEEPIKAYQAPKEPVHVYHDRLEWKTPGQWIEWPGPDEQTHGFTVEETNPPLELTITALPRQSPSAGDVTANVNRWQRQLEMPLSSKAEVRSLVKRVTADERTIFVVNLMGPAGADQKQILGGMVVDGERVWFFKLMGAAARVAKHHAEFDQLISSIKLNTPRDFGPQKGMKDDLAFTKPAGWEYGADATLRVLTMYGGDALDSTEVVVTKLGGTSFGAILDNINRWRGQVGLEPVAKPEDQPSERIQLAGNPAVYFDLSGPGTAENPNQRLLLVMSMINNDVWFFKMIGEQQVVAAQKPKFEEFLKSVEIAK